MIITNNFMYQKYSLRILSLHIIDIYLILIVIINVCF